MKRIPIIKTLRKQSLQRSQGGEDGLSKWRKTAEAKCLQHNMLGDISTEFFSEGLP